MVALKSGEIDAFVARPDPRRPIALVFGPDAGLVRERVDALVKAAVDDPADPFGLARLDGDALADEPSRLVEEAHTFPLFGGRRAVWVKAGGRNFTAAVEALLAAPPAADCRVVIEAGDLKRNAPLRAMCEKSAVAAALPCYADGDREITRLIDEVLAVVADGSALALDGAVDAAFAGRAGEVETQFAKARAAGTYPGVIVSAALRQVAQLHRARLAIEDGAEVSAAIATTMPGLHFRRKGAVEAALSAWSAARLEKIMAQFAEASLEARRRPALAEAIAQRALMATARTARRRES